MLKYLVFILISFLLKSSFTNTTEWIRAGDSIYKYHTELKNWHAAKEACRLEGASLFFAENKDESDAVLSIWINNTKKTNRKKTWLYLGLKNLVNESAFVTIDGRPIEEVYVNWRKGEPNNYGGHENCVQMNQEGLFNDCPCHTKLNFFCKKNTFSSRPRRRSITSSNIYFDNSKVALQSFVFWPNATVPFFINLDHFDQDQETVILKSLSMFEFNTCIKFAPVMSAPSETQHVMTFINPEGVRRCKIETKGHSNNSPHLIQLGYDCLNTPDLDMIIMRALGLPFEHNRPSRDVFIDVLIENIEPSYTQLFTKEGLLPNQLRHLPYDHNSIMHFGERDYSKNGHRTIKFKSRSFRQYKNGLTPTDIKKIALIYGPQCRTRDRAKKIAICQTYPGVGRRKREIEEPSATMSLSVNANNTPPPHMKLRRKSEATNRVTLPKSAEEIKEKKEQFEKKYRK